MSGLVGPVQAPTSQSEVAISVVVPVFNEVGNIGALHESLTDALSQFGRSYEIVIVDDGSTDGTRELLRLIARQDPHVHVVLFRRNYGQTAAMATGFDRARGDLVISMDGDLQNDPADIPRLIEKLEQGYDIVCGWRRHRKDRFTTRLLPSLIANRLISWTTAVPIHDTGCSLKAYRGWVVRSMHLYSDMHRVIAAIAAGLGARVAEVPVRHHARRFGKSKYGLSRIFRVLVDLLVIKMLIQFAAHPLRWFTMFGLPMMTIGAILFGQTIWDALARPSRRIDLVSMTVASVASLVGFNLVLLGLLAELQLKASGVLKHRNQIMAREAAL